MVGGRGRLCAGCFDALNLQVFDIKGGGTSAPQAASSTQVKMEETALNTHTQKNTRTPRWGGRGAGRGGGAGGVWNEKLGFCESRIWFSLALTFRDKRSRQPGRLVCVTREGGGRLGLVALGNDTLCRPTTTSFQVNKAAAARFTCRVCDFFFFNSIVAHVAAKRRCEVPDVLASWLAS